MSFSFFSLFFFRNIFGRKTGDDLAFSGGLFYLRDSVFCLLIARPRHSTLVLVLEWVKSFIMADFVGRRIMLKDLPEYIDGLEFGVFDPKLIVVHHTAIPNLAQRTDGLSLQHIQNLWSYYRGKGWSGGPHMFVDDKGIWIMQDLNQRGVHAVSFNKNSIGIEMLGDYDSQSDFENPRGRLIRIYTQRLVAKLLDCFSLDIKDVRFHRDDPKTKKTCPGRYIDKEDFLAQVSRYKK